MWSIGVMTYLMISGRLPFNGEDENKIAREIVFNEPDFNISFYIAYILDINIKD